MSNTIDLQNYISARWKLFHKINDINQVICSHEYRKQSITFDKSTGDGHATTIAINLAKLLPILLNEAEECKKELEAMGLKIAAINELMGFATDKND